MRIAALLGLMIMAAELPMPARAALADWKPVFFDTHSAVTLQSTYGIDERKTNQGLDDKTTRHGFRESVKLDTSGYLYHPDLAIFGLSGTYGEDQNKLYDDSGQSQNTSGGYDNYDLSALFLRNKPYTLKTTFSKDTPFSTSITGGVNNETTEESETEFNYKQRLYRARLRYDAMTRTSAGRSRETDNYDLNASFSKPKLGPTDDFLAIALARYQEDFEMVKRRSGDTVILNESDSIFQQSGLSNSFTYRIFDFSTDINAYSTDLNAQEKSDTANNSRFSMDFVNLNENINIRLPWDFSSRVEFATATNDNTNSILSTKSTSSTDEDRFKFDLTQKLYESLVTELRADLESVQSSRTDSMENGIGNDQGPTKDNREKETYDLASNYRKRLPFESGLSGGVSTSINQISRLGRAQIVAEKDVCDQTGLVDNLACAEIGNKIELRSDTDLNALISVEVLKDPNCLEPDKNQTCWITLSEAAGDYVINDTTRPITIEIGDLSDGHVIGLELEEYKKINHADGGPFTFRTTSYLPNADFVVQSNTSGFSAGLGLFRYFSSDYNHTLTTQELVKGALSSGETLASDITEDEVTLGFTLPSFSSSASRHWTKANDSETITELRARYDNSLKVLSTSTLRLGAEAYNGEAETTHQQDEPALSSEERYSYLVDLVVPVPYIKAQFKGRHSYAYNKGQIIRLALNADGFYSQTQNLGVGKRTYVRNSIGLTKPFTIPRIDFVANSYVSYEWDTVTGDNGSDTALLLYGVNAVRTWLFGATSLNLNINYAINDNSLEESGNAFARDSRRREERDNLTSVTLTLVRRLF